MERCKPPTHNANFVGAPRYRAPLKLFEVCIPRGREPAQVDLVQVLTFDSFTASQLHSFIHLAPSPPIYESTDQVRRLAKR